MIWFAAGAFCAAFAAVLARLLVAPSDEPHAYLTVYDRGFSEEDMERLEEIASSSAQLFHSCGAKDFLISNSGVDKPGLSLIQITRGNEDAVHCIQERAIGEGYSLQIRVLTDRQTREL